MEKMFRTILFFTSLIIIPTIIYGKDNVVVHPFFNGLNKSEIPKPRPANIAPTLTATGNQFFCPGNSVKIVTNMTITDPDDTGIDAIYVQISSGYAAQDLLTLTGSHPNISANWNATTAVLTLTGVSSAQPTYVDLINAIKDIEYSTSASNPSGSRDFSISVGQANYLPSNGHYYLFIPNIGITWSDARIAAENSNYYGLQGYLATITSAEEAQIAGEQTTGAGWIGGSDADVEGTWKWVTGPETGAVFWNGNFTGFTATYAFWNTGEPNNTGQSNNSDGEDYAHINASGIGIRGSWNDLSNTGGASGDYQPKGYIVEYGGMPGDPVLHISTSTSLTIPSISSTLGAARCGSGTLNLQAAANVGTINWYDTATGGTPIGSGSNFTTPNINTTTIFYAAAHFPGCTDILRIPVTASVAPKPVLTVASPYYICNESNAVIDIPISIGVIFWYDSPTATSAVFSGPHFAPNIHQNTTFYAEANYNNCVSNRESFLVVVYSSPVVSDETFKLCEGDRITLDAQNTGMTYLWSTGQTTQTIESDGNTETYSVTITTLAPESCSKVKNFNITYHPQPIISNVDVQGLSITINTTESGDFEYSLNGQDFQASNTFTVIEGGIYTAYVREKNGCGTDQESFVAISYPAFFTPNGDGLNETWFIKGGNGFSSTQAMIFNRFGKLITVLNAGNPFWDGKFNGELLPADDYWFVAKVNDSFPEIRGHFSLKR